MDVRRIAQLGGAALVIPKFLEVAQHLVDAIGFYHLPTDLSEAIVRLSNLPAGGASWAPFVIGLGCLSFLIYDTMIKQKAHRYGGLSAFVRARLGKSMWLLAIMAISMIVFVISAIIFAAQQQRILIDKEFATNTISAAEEKSAKREFSYEEQRFRSEARTFALSDCTRIAQGLSEVIAKATTDVAGDPTMARYIRDFMNIGDLNVKFQALNAYANEEVEMIDPYILSSKISDFLQSYRGNLLVLWMTRMKKTTDDENQKFLHWREYDMHAKDDLTRLKTISPKFLKDSAPEEIFSNR